MMEALRWVLIDPIRWALLQVLEQAYALTGSYGLSIVVMSLVFNLALMPAYHLAEKVQNRERRVVRRMTPKIEEFKFAFRGEERYWMLRALYRQHGYHPIYALRGLLPLAIQIPFFIATFGLLSGYAPLAGESFLSIRDLGAPDGLLFGVNLLPIVMTAFNWLAVELYSRELPQRERVQSLVVAVVFLVLLYRSPSGLVLYWTTNNLISVARSLRFAQRRARVFAEGNPC